ncbi:Extensin-like protein precursor [Labilithrix luteola]|uniref:Extensin-like protein n=2 Tax=Labilithrix luteola TaxID=1391654 RepID=A0A0K1PVC3_9BACT|nr:Extensin-like protein precursor [Labilithrix luteola]
MLPKFRPLSEGREGPARPAIRPVKPSPPPPPPTPLRRTSDVRVRESRPPRSYSELVDSDNDTTDRDPRKSYDEPPTLDTEPATLDGCPATSPIRSVAPSFQVREMRELALSFDEETQARPIDDHLLSSSRDDAHAASDLDAALVSLPSLEVRAPFDSYEAAFAERDPVTLHASQARNSSDSSESSYEPYPAPPRSYQEATPRAQRPNEGSGPRERPEARPEARPEPRLEVRPRTASYAAPVPAFDDISESNQWARMAARGPQNMRSGPSYPPPPPAPAAAPAHYSQPPMPRPMQLTPPPDAWQRAPMHPQQNMMTAPMQAAPVAPYRPALSSPAAPVSPSMILHQQQLAAGVVSGPYAPVGTVRGQIAPMPAEAPKPSRFAWFVAGAAFGVAFAFFATGVFSGKRPHEEATNAPVGTHAPVQVTATAQGTIPVPVQVATPVTPVVQAQPVFAAPQPVAVAPPVQTVQAVQPVAPRVAAPVVEPTPVSTFQLADAAKSAPAPTVEKHTAPPPAPHAAPRATTVARRPAAPASTGASAPSIPKPIQGADIDPAPSGGGDNFGDLLGAALKP